MSKLSKAVAETRAEQTLSKLNPVTNFMGGISYTYNPLDTLKMITSSSIFGEPSYYRDSADKKKQVSRLLPYVVDELVTDSIITDAGKNTVELMIEAIDNALTYDFKGTLEWAKELRKFYNIRLNPQIIMVRAAIHPGRKEFTENNPGTFNAINQEVMTRADEPMTQMAYYLYTNKDKNNIPSILKRSWATNLSNLNRYKVAKYKNHEIGMINATRICHAHSKALDELMKTGTIDLSGSKSEKTWENLRSEGMTWDTILSTIQVGHMALLRNLNGIFKEITDLDTVKRILDQLIAGVPEGKQLPFRYYNALTVLGKECSNPHKTLIFDALEDCMDKALENMPKLKGRTMCLSDNSGSAWGSIPSEYGTVTIAEIDNLSSVITASLSDEGYVGKFGDKLKVMPISKRSGILKQAQEISTKRDNDVGGGTEGGIWVFLSNAIKNKEHWDNIFIYSDQQAGHGDLYGTSEQKREYKNFAAGSYSYIDVYKLIKEYRNKVNPKVNVYSIQTAGYNNNVLPEYTPRTTMLYGWTGKEVLFADMINKQWDEISNR